MGRVVLLGHYWTSWSLGPEPGIKVVFYGGRGTRERPELLRVLGKK